MLVTLGAESAHLSSHSSPLHKIPPKQATKPREVQTNYIYLKVQKYHVFTYILYTASYKFFYNIIAKCAKLVLKIKIYTNTILCIPKT